VAGLTQGALASKIRYSRSTVANVETGRQRAPRSFWRRCDDALGLGSGLLRLYDETELLHPRDGGTTAPGPEHATARQHPNSADRRYGYVRPWCTVYNIDLRFDVEGASQVVLVNFGDPQLHPGAGQHGLHLTATVAQHGLVGGTLLLQGDSTVAGPDGHPRRWLATFTHTNPLYLRGNGITSDCQLVMAVTDEQLWRIEDMRRGDDFQLDLRINPVLVYDGRTYPMINHAQYQVRIDRYGWLQQLANAERTAHFMVAVPAVGDGSNGMASVVKLLREAEAAYRDNRDRDAATAVRRAVERFRTLIMLPLPKSIDATAREQRDEHQRWAAVFYAILGILNAAPHGDIVTEAVKFDRRDGQAVIAIAMGLLGRDWT
jgi:hypothetical protein